MVGQPAADSARQRGLIPATKFRMCILHRGHVHHRHVRWSVKDAGCPHVAGVPTRLLNSQERHQVAREAVEILNSAQLNKTSKFASLREASYCA